MGLNHKFSHILILLFFSVIKMYVLLDFEITPMLCALILHALLFRFYLFKSHMINFNKTCNLKIMQ